ncbi:tRNA modification GTPase MnmE [Alteracholeplasma palmae J233]|uniref:tRNA modification GTPase MnmE n=1 Tax=Alteracholeplasma palmae (strain ATCC 49389 / J233) TaxID=1318466 RepID=U4KQQ5_ALTPJ|nr:tRNA uridine-5-carboxymethylaminomethyl(34) synthesis GTPase MnmE [Alteracholeplasma palmae]CCV64990.1 tRNA modification GTPase MnmE [Alteracholeplasma palmae J233]
MIFDTIAAIATPIGTAGISVIRVSGDDAITQINTIFKGKSLNKKESHTITYGHILNEDGSVLDEVMVSIFRAPKSFTGENVVEVSTHGGILITQMVLERILTLDIRLARPGEFSERAYLNKRIDLVQAEAIMDIIHAKNENAIKVAHLGLQKETSQLIKNLKEKLLTVVAQIEVNIDYPEYDDAVVMSKEIVYPKTLELIKEMEEILTHSKKTRYIRDGIKTAIVGKPNVGKSSLLNALLDEDRAIVTDIAGTTRDTIDAYVNLGGFTLHLIDTAGIRQTEDKVEQIGVTKSRKAITEAELVLLVLDQSSDLTEEDLELLELTKDYPRILIGNKSDLTRKLDLELVSISSLNKVGLKELEQTILKKLQLENLEQKDFNYLSNVRHIKKIKDALNALKDVLEAINNDMPVDIYVLDLTNAWNDLGEILGDNGYGDLLTELFSKFCLGK